MFIQAAVLSLLEEAGGCFAAGGCHELHKYNLGVCANTFIVLIRKNIGKIDEPMGSDNVLARAWGFYNPKTPAVNICNLYMRGIGEGVVYSVLHKMASSILKKEVKDVDVEKDMITIYDDVYHNKGRHDLTYYPKDVKGFLAEQVL